MMSPRRNVVKTRFIAIVVAVNFLYAASPAREEIELNGEWEYQKVSDLTYPPPDEWQATTVPGYLRGYNYEKAWFRRTFALPDSMSGMRIKLTFGGVKFDSKVYVNGQLVGGQLNGYDPFELDVTREVRFGEENELLVGLSDWTALFSDPVDFSNLSPGESPRDRPRNVILAPIGGRYDLYGIWQGVVLRGVPDLSIEDFGSFSKRTFADGPRVHPAAGHGSGAGREAEFLVPREERTFGSFSERTFRGAGPLHGPGRLQPGELKRPESLLLKKEAKFVMTSVRQNKITVRMRVRNDGAEKKIATLTNNVLDGEETVLTLPDANVAVGAYESLDVDVEAQWPDPHLWRPSDPHLYHLETTLEPSGGSADKLTTRFGFREFWCENDSFYLNGTKIHLLATSCWPSDNLMEEEDIRKVLRDVKAGNNVAFRLHTQPWNETWYDLADEVGVLIVEEGAVWCDPRGYRLADPTFWANFADHLTGAIRRDRNHPSIVMWSLENELLHCGGGGIYAGTETELAKLGRLVKGLDPTRPITYEADLDPGGEADVIGLHYPHEFPAYHLWPNTAYWMDDPINLAHAPGGTWQWNRQKPLYIGEFLWVPGSSPDGFSILYGDEAYTDPTYYRNRAKGWTWRMQIEAYRDYGVSAICPWTMFEDIATRWGTLDLKPDENHLYQVQKAAYHPNAVFVKEYDARFFVGEQVERSVTIYNDTMDFGSFSKRALGLGGPACRSAQPARQSPDRGFLLLKKEAKSSEFTLKWTAGGNADTRTLSLQPAERKREIITFRVPSMPGDFTFRIELLKGETTAFSDEKFYSAYPQPALSLPEGARLAVYDTDGTTAHLFAQQGLSYHLIADLRAAHYDQFDILVIGSNSLREEEVFQVGAESIAGKWEDFTDRGGWIVVLEQSSYPRWMPLAISPADYSANFAFPRVPGHAIVSGVSAEDLRWWRGDNRVTAGNIPKPSRGNFRVLVDVGSQNGLDHAAMIEIPRGRGGYICSQMLLTAKFTAEPMAGILLQRILNYCSATKHRLRHAGVVAEADSEAAKTLSQLGLLHENLLGRLAAHDLAAYPLLVIAGGENAWSEATACLEKLVSYVETGGTVLLHRPSDAFLSEAGTTLIPNLEAAANAALPILRNVSDDRASSLTNYDLYWIDQPGTWNRAATLSEDIAERVYRKRFTLDNYIALEVEDMPVKTGGSPTNGGWNMYVNGYVAQNITAAESAPYLFGVVARATQALGEYPRMALRIDGKFRDAVIVDSETWRLYTLAAELTAGEHELALAFTNDAWDPPDDRNLYMDKVRYGPDPLPKSELFITTPGAIVRVDRGKGFILLDEITWEKEEKNRGKAETIISTILTDLGALIRTPSGLRLEAEEMNPVGFGYFRILDGIAWCGSNGRLESTILFTSSGTYSFEVTGYGTPALGVYPELELRIDGSKRDSVFVNTETPSQFLLSATVAEGSHTIALAFVNDYYEPPQDRNLALDRLIISQVRETSPRILDLVMAEQSGTATLIWEAKPGDMYGVEFLTDLIGETWRSAGNVVGAGNVMSWTDDGASTGSPPGNRLVRERYYRIEAVAGP